MWRTESWFGTGTFLSQVTGPVVGNRPGSGRALVENAVYVRGRDTAGRLFVKKLRGVLSGSDIAGGALSASTVAWFNDFYITPLRTIDLRTLAGGAVTELELYPLPIMWHMRRGSKRRARSVLL